MPGWESEVGSHKLEEAKEREARQRGTGEE